MIFLGSSLIVYPKLQLSDHLRENSKLAATVDQESQLAEDGDKASTEDPEGAVDDYMIQDTLVAGGMGPGTGSR